jgi:hypothetical protein
MKTVKIFVPRDSAALALGADEVAKSLLEKGRHRGLSI